MLRFNVEKPLSAQQATLREGKMSQPTNISKATVALSIVCVLLGAFFALTLALYLPAQNNITTQQQTIHELNSEISGLQAQLSSAPNVTVFQNQINELNAEVSSLNQTLGDANHQYSDLSDIVALNKSTEYYSNTTVQLPHTNTTVIDADLGYAGYIIVESTSNESSTFAAVSYKFDTYTLTFNQTLGSSGSALFPVLSGKITMVLGNLETTNGTQVQATVTYYY